jgi:hypothetical protein
MKKVLIIAIFLLIGSFIYAQTEIGGPDPQRLGIESAQQMLKEISVDKFEHDGFWRSTMSSDEGYAASRLFSGSPAGKEPILEEAGLNIQDQYVFGTRVDFLHRGYNSFRIYPTRPIPIEGITKTVSVWVAGRNYNHDLTLLIQDFFGRYYEFYMGKLNFMGWKKMTAVIPPQADDGFSGVVQRNYHYNSNMGIKIVGFRIDCDPLETYGSYYIYLDDLRATTDLFSEYHRDPDDMVDGW